uniref:Peptidase S1 domain-containing protein n=1 Tax=Astatotilapia calliptera TaxID=8154 RepID=A0A3P8QTW5_ASTCA
MIYCITCIFLQVSLTGAAESSIIGGREAKPHSRPYMASLQYQEHHSCGGMLIREDFVHCIHGFSIICKHLRSVFPCETSHLHRTSEKDPLNLNLIST